MGHLLEAAEAYAARGWHIFPLRPKAKQPARAGGFKKATTDVEAIHRYWTLYPQANIGIYPGPSGLCVIDIDGPVGERSALTLGLGSLNTLTAQTGRSGGGRHLYFRHPGGHVGNAKIADGIDIRADAGY